MGFFQLPWQEHICLVVQPGGPRVALLLGHPLGLFQDHRCLGLCLCVWAGVGMGVGVSVGVRGFVFVCGGCVRA